MALTATVRVLFDRCRASRNIVRVVTGQACHRAFALEKALGFAKAIGRTAYDFKLVVMARSGRVIEGEQEIAEWLARTKRVGATIETAHKSRHLCTCRFQVALHAAVHRQSRAEPCRIHNAGSDIFRLRACGPNNLKLLRHRTVATLAVDPLR